MRITLGITRTISLLAFFLSRTTWNSQCLGYRGQGTEFATAKTLLGAAVPMPCTKAEGSANIWACALGPERACKHGTP